jgi:hypothetical protein
MVGAMVNTLTAACHLMLRRQVAVERVPYTYTSLTLWCAVCVWLAAARWSVSRDVDWLQAMASSGGQMLMCMGLLAYMLSGSRIHARWLKAVTLLAAVSSLADLAWFALPPSMAGVEAVVLVEAVQLTMMLRLATLALDSLAYAMTWLMVWAVSAATWTVIVERVFS